MRLLARALTSSVAFALALAAPLGVGAAGFGTCSFSVASVAFGNYNPTSSSATTANGSVSIVCILPTSVTLSLSQGNGMSYAPRTMSGTGGTLPYNLFTDAGLSSVWGDGTTSSTKTVTQTFTLFSAAVPIYGAIAPLQNAVAGSYTDTITATATF